ncbi:efflux RND transporter permease subunit [Thiocystis violacea]|uniref:efflux RND transporter permease subunit n=1 Tax=Thiocystis violacea TaxID=13725 RepID=UPI0019070232|nr:efflux RND transporter permease subunit [Thiocystis violacea]MBK1722692.1 RND transporter [Thiocystis violacea]
MNVSAWSIRHPVPAILLFILLGLLGLAGFHALGIQNFPDIELPRVIVTANLEGAAPSQLETDVARKIEDQIATIGGVQHITTTLSDGSASIQTEFDIDINIETALNDVRNAVDTVRSELPQDMTDPIVSKVNTAGSAVITFTVGSDRLDEEALSWFVDNDVSKALLAVRGVGAVSRVGGVDREVGVDLDPTRMAALGVTASDISGRLKQVQQDASGGRGDIGAGVQSVRTLGAVHDIGEIGALDIPLDGGHSVRLDEIARVHDSIAERTAYALLNGRPVVGFSVTRLKGSSEVAVAEAVRAAVDRLRERYPQVRIAEAYDTVAPVLDNYQGSMELLYEGAFLAILVVWWFLRDWRATLVAAAALPLSIIPTFAAMHWLGFSLNVLTLLSMALVVGILVDDAIVEIENIVRHLRMGKKPIQAATEAADEIGVAVIATSLTLVAVFLPTGFMGGVPGKFFREFGITAAIAVVFSLAVARMLTPMMSAYLLKPHAPGGGEGRLMRTYLTTAAWSLDHRKTTLLGAVLFFAGSIALVPLLPTGFIPPADVNQTAVKIELPPGSTLAETRDAAEQARQLLAPINDITSVFTTVGAIAGAGPFNEGGSADIRKASLMVNLVHRNDRARSQIEIEQEIRERLKALPGARVSVGIGGVGERLQLVLAGDDPELLDRASKAVERDLRSLPNLGNISSNASLQRPEIHVDVDFARAADLGVTTSAIATAIRVATAGDFEVQLPKLNLPQRQIPIRVRLDPELRTDLDAIAHLRLPAWSGQVPLSAVADVSLSSGPAQIDRLDRERNVTIDVELAGRALGEVMAQVDPLPSLQHLPPGISRPASGDAERMAQVFSGFATAMLTGILCIYIVLVLLFHDFLQPTTILTALPLSVGGAFAALLLTHNSFSLPSIIGVLMLMGIVTKNSILLVEYAVKARREHGLERREALLDACRKRAQPILMTTIAMVAGMLPTALGLGAEPSFRSPMAIAVIGGLLTSTVLSLLVIPVVFTFVDDLVKGLRRARMWASKDRHAEPDATEAARHA